MKHFHFDSLRSTTLKAQELLESGQKSPFSLTAERQTEGRGRNGQKWESPVGGLYFQAVYLYEESKTNRLPQKIAYLLAKWFQEEFDLKFTIKWPNDLLFQGKKIAGILCEVLSFSGKSYLSIGIGLNVLESPKLKDSPYHSISLAEITKKNYNLDELGLSFQAYFKNSFPMLKEFPPSEEELDQFFLPKGSLWKNKKEIFSYEGMTEEGFMILKDKEKKLSIVQSAHHPYTFCGFYTEQSTPNKESEI